MGNEIHVEEVPEIPDGVYRFKIVKHEPFDQGYEPCRRLFFRIDPSTGHKGVITGIFPDRATTKNKTGALLRAAGVEPVPGQTYSWSQVEGLVVYALVKNAVTSEGTFSRVKNVIYPPPGTSAMTSGPPQPQPASQPVSQPAGNDDNWDVPF